MMRRILTLLFLLITVTNCAQTVKAEPIFSDDFQDGEADGWGAGGSGDVRLTTYDGNISLRLSQRATSFAAITTKGYRNVRIMAEMAADDLEADDFCLVEASADNGKSWMRVLRITDGQDDAVTLHPGQLSDKRLDDAPRIIIRAQIKGNASNDTCWLDNVRITGDWIADRSEMRSELSASFLTGQMPLNDPARMSAFAPNTSTSPAERFSGRLSFVSQPARSNIRVLLDEYDYNPKKNPDFARLPRFDFNLVSKDGQLLPARRGLIASDHPFWEFVLAPGRVWKQAGDGGWSRAALPFALVEKNANCTHNGVLSFLYKSDGSVSRIVWQIASETCAYFQFNAWGSAPATYHPGAIQEAPALIARDRAERAACLPIRPIAALQADYPKLNPAAFGSAQDIKPADLTAFGLIIDGRHYSSDCPTRFGPYPYCDEMALPSYSLAKSLFAGLALMRLERLYPGAKNALIRDYVPECAAQPGWEGITFEHALDMATGHYDSPASNKDEDTALKSDFFTSLTHRQKISHACTVYKKKTAPGQKWVYHTSDTYLLGSAMQAYFQDKRGRSADIYADLLVRDIWKPLHLSPTLDVTRRTYDDEAQAFTGWGLVMQRSDLARLMQFLNTGQGHIAGRSMLDPDMLAGALQQNSSDTGLKAGSDDLRYNNGFWAWNYENYGQCNTAKWIPFMSGFGGITAVLIPNGASYYYFSDGGAYKFAYAVKETTAAKPLCRSSP